MSKFQVLILFSLTMIVVMLFMIIAGLAYLFQRETPVNIQFIVTPTPTIITGSGDDILSFTSTGGDYVIRSLYDDNGRFIIIPVNRGTGQRLDPVADCTNKCQRSSTINLEPGQWVLEIHSEGYWGLEMERQ